MTRRLQATWWPALAAAAALGTAAVAQQTVDFTYDAAGRVVGVDYGGGQVVTYAYDKRGNLLRETGHPPKEHPTADVAVAKSASSSPVMAGSNITYTIEVANHGPDPATGVTVSDALPGVALSVAESFSQGGLELSGNLLTWRVGVLERAASASLTLIIKPILQGSVTNVAAVFSIPADPNTSNNVSAAVTFVSMSGDADGDGMPDWGEEANGLDGNAGDAEGDEDRDGVTNGEEYLADTDPRDNDSALVIENIRSPSPVRIDFPTSPVRVYRVQFAPAPAGSAAWSNLQAGIPGSGGTISVTDTNPAAQRSYRIGAELP
jgi:uncharacterized repeat protein (TIGR01451 family)